MLRTNGPQWVETVDLGDHLVETLYILVSISLIHWYRSGVFSLKNRSIKPLTFPKDQ
jgi:hypothetical protein